MAILIKNLDMPPDGEYKHIRIYDNGEVMVEIGGEEEVIATASQVPPHGRLIDADAFEKFILDNWPESDAWIAGHIEYRPTVIEAEEGET